LFAITLRVTPPIQLSRKKAAKKPGVRWDALNQFCAFAEPASLTPVQRVAHSAYWYASLVEAGGHHEYFAHVPRPDHDQVLAALQTVGACDQAAILVAARGAVAVASSRAPEEYADKYVAGVEFADFEEFDQAFEHCSRPVSACLMDYVDKHESDFIEWRP
jgi:hypothetical protein